MNMGYTPITFLGVGNSAQVQTITGGDILNKKLMEMGVKKGALIQIISNDSGPLILKIDETRLVINRGMAQKILVSEV